MAQRCACLGPQQRVVGSTGGGMSDTVLSDTVLSDTVLSDTVLSDTVLSDTVLSDTVCCGVRPGGEQWPVAGHDALHPLHAVHR